MIGAQLADRYEIIRELGRGGMGVVYAARDPVLDREVAVKLMPQASLGPDAVDRSLREARLVAGMDHPSIVPVHDMGEHQGALFIVMPLVRGTSLRTSLQTRSLRLSEVVEIASQVAEALEYSHARGVVHRDIKPENILITPESSGLLRARVTDFGLARVFGEDRLTRTGVLVGTAAYLSPEQVSAEDVDGRSDIYSLGTVLYECLVGETPFAGDVHSVLYRIVNEIPSSPRSRGVTIPQELDDIVMRCIEKHRQKRPQRCRDVTDALASCRSQMSESEAERAILSIPLSAQPRRVSATPLIGRSRELGELQARLNLAVSGECEFVVLAGEAGSGKSRLLDEIEKLATVRRIRVLHGRFVEEDRSFPYQGFCEAIQEYFRYRALSASIDLADFSDLIPELTYLFPALAEIGALRSSASRLSSPSIPVKPADRDAIFDLLARTMTRIAASQPLVLMLEDLHLADVSIEALQHLVRRLGPSPTLVVATYRTTDVGKGHPLLRMLDSFRGDHHFTLVNLMPFSPADHRIFLEALLGSPKLDDNLVEKIYDGAEGNPYFTSELVRSLCESGSIIQGESGSWQLAVPDEMSGIPPTIQRAIERRIEGLRDDLREILSVAAILGKSFEVDDLLWLTAGGAAVEDGMEELLRDGFLREDRGSRGERLTFSSGLLRDVTYRGASRRKRRALHRRYAEELERRSAGHPERSYPQLLFHYAEADVPAKAVEYGLAQAKKSLDSHSPQDAISAARTALDFLEDGTGERDLIEAEIRLVLGAAFRMDGQIGLALREISTAVGLIERRGDSSRLVSALLMAAETAWDGQRIEETTKWVGKALHAARTSSDKASLMRLLSLGSTLANLRGDTGLAREYLDEMERARPTAPASEDEIPEGGTLVVGMPIAFHITHPARIVLDEEAEILANVVETLVGTDSRGRLVPWLCERWKPLDEGRSFLFALRPNVRMQDGTPMTAIGVKKAMEQAISRSRDALPPAFAAIDGVTEYLQRSADGVAGITAVSEGDLRIQLREQLPIYPALHTDVRAGITHEASAGDGPPIIGTGPFVLSSLKEDRILLRRNAKYWGSTAPQVEAVEFRCRLSPGDMTAGIRSGELDIARDMLPEDIDAILRDRRLQIRLFESPKRNVYFVLFNCHSPLGRIPELREALFRVIRTRDLISKTAGRFAQPAEGLLPPGILGHNPGRRQEHISRERASQLLQSVTPLPVKLRAAAHPIMQERYASVTNALFNGWKAVGAEISIVTPDMTSFMQTKLSSEGIDLVLGRWIADYADPDDFTRGLFHSKAGRFRIFYSSEDVDRMCDAARSESNTASRETIYRRIEDHLLGSAVIAPLFHESDCRLAGPQVRDLVVSSSPPYVNYSEVRKIRRTATLQTSGRGVLHVPIAGEVRSIDPTLVSSVFQSEVIPAVFETLAREAEGNRTAPWLASEIRAEKGGKEFHVRLRQDVHFHDGRRMTARDVRYSFERWLQKVESGTRWYLSPIRGAKAILEGRSRELEGLHIVSPSEIIIELDEPVAFFPALLAYPSAAIVPEGTEQFASGRWRDGCVGTGPFRMLRFDPGRLIEMEANPGYWRGGYPKVDGLVFTCGVTPQGILAGFRSGQFSVAWDLSPSDVESLLHDREFAAHYYAAARLCTYMVVFNTRRGPLSDERLRLRVARAVDVEGLVKRHLGRLAVPARGLIPPGLLGHEPSTPASHRTVGTATLGGDVELTGMVHSIFHGTYADFAKDLLAGLERAGIHVRVVDTKAEHRDRTEAVESIDLILTRWIGDYPDADTFVYGLLDSKKGREGVFSGSEGVDRLAERARAETDLALRHSIYREAEETIARRALLVPLFHEQAYRFARPEIQGLKAKSFAPIVGFVPYEEIWIGR